MIWAFVCLFGLMLPACQSVQSDGPQVAPTPAPLGAALSITPGDSMPGERVTATIQGIHTDFGPGTDVDLGDGIVIEAVVVQSPTTVDVTFQVALDAVEGYRTLEIDQGDALPIALIDEALLVQRGHVFISPDGADRGQSIWVTINTEGYALSPGFSWVDFGLGTHVESFVVDDDGVGLALVSIFSDASPGLRDVIVTEGPLRLRLKNGFEIGRSLIAVKVTPEVVSQGEEEVLFTVEGYNTHFVQGKTHLDFGIGFYVDEEDPTAVIVQSETRIQVKVKVCRATIPGLHQLTVSSELEDEQLEMVRAERPIEVLEVPGTIAEGYASFNLSLSRSFTPNGIEETVYAVGVFGVVAGSCEPGNGTSCSVSTQPYDQPSFYPPPGCTPESSTVVNPPSPSLDAGPSVFLIAKGGDVVIRLDKNEDTDGTLYYSTSEAIPRESFLFNTAYSVQIPGGTGESAVPETELKDIILTPPSDYFIREPDLSYAPTINPYDALQTRWEDQNGNPGTGNFPVASLSITVRTSAALDGALSQISQLPVDDGDYSIPASYMSQLYPGAGRMIFSLTRIGPVYSLPGSAYRSYSTSGVSYSGLLEVRE